MMKRIAALLAMSVVAFQALTGVASAATSTDGFGDAYSRTISNDIDLSDGQCSDEGTVELFIYDGEIGCYGDNANATNYEPVGDIDQPLEVEAGKALVINLGTDDDTLANYRGVEMELYVQGVIIFDGDEAYDQSGYAGFPDKSVKLTVTQTGFVGLGLDNAVVENAASVAFFGSFDGDGTNDVFDASALTVDIVNTDDSYFSSYDGGINGGLGNDILKGGAGDDAIYGDVDKDTLYGNAGDDILDGGDGNDVIYGGEGNDEIECDGSNDTEQCWGGVGDDDFTITANGGGADVTVAPGDGADHLDFGNGGNDAITLYFGDMTKAHSLTIDPVNGNDKCEASDFGEDTAEGDCSDLATIVGTGFDDVFDVSAIDNNDGDDMVIAGGAGNDIIVGPAAGDSVVLSGGSGNDRLFDGGGTADAALLGSTGNDRLVGGSGANLLAGGPGRDKAFGGSGADVVAGGRGDDTLYGEAGGDTVAAGAGNDLAFGGDDDDAITGAKGNDRLSSGGGDDDTDGGAGNDQLHGDVGDDKLTGGPGYDRAWGDNDDYDAYANPFGGDYCNAEVVANCEWNLAVGPSGPYWVKLV